MLGSTGGMYHPDHSHIDAFLKMLATAVDNGNGGDGPENDMEAILASQQLCLGEKDFVLIADSSAIRDISLASQIKRPVYVIICDSVSDDYMQLAKMTKEASPGQAVISIIVVKSATSLMSILMRWLVLDKMLDAMLFKDAKRSAIFDSI
jgi:hypothetical protein